MARAPQCTPCTCTSRNATRRVGPTCSCPHSAVSLNGSGTYLKVPTPRPAQVACQSTPPPGCHRCLGILCVQRLDLGRLSPCCTHTTSHRAASHNTASSKNRLITTAPTLITNDSEPLHAPCCSYCPQRTRPYQCLLANASCCTTPCVRLQPIPGRPAPEPFWLHQHLRTPASTIHSPNVHSSDCPPLAKVVASLSIPYHTATFHEVRRNCDSGVSTASQRSSRHKTLLPCVAPTPHITA